MARQRSDRRPNPHPIVMEDMTHTVKTSVLICVKRIARSVPFHRWCFGKRAGETAFRRIVGCNRHNVNRGNLFVHFDHKAVQATSQLLYVAQIRALLAQTFTFRTQAAAFVARSRKFDSLLVQRPALMLGVFCEIVQFAF